MEYLWLQLLILVILLFLSAFFSGSECALFSLSQVRLERFEQEEDKKGKLIVELLKNPRRVLISILSVNMFVNIYSSTLAERIAERVLGEMGLEISIVVMGFLILVFGEIAPKTIAIHNAERISFTVAPIISTVSKVIFPVRRLVRAIVDLIIRLVSMGEPPPESGITEEELKVALEAGGQEGVLDLKEKEMMQRVIDLGKKRAADVMSPKTQMFTLDIDSPIDEVISSIREKRYSRIPVYKGDFDNVVGILYAKDLLGAKGKDDFEMSRRLRSVSFVPEQKRAGEILREFRRDRIHIALAVDEYGSVSGLVTMEDLLEEIFGKVADKEETDTLFERIDSMTVRVAGQIELDAFNEVFGTNLQDEAHKTIGGFIIGRLGKIPDVGYKLVHDNMEFVVTEAEANRIHLVEVRKLKDQGELSSEDTD